MDQKDDEESRTEEPTEKRTQDAFERGDVPVSREAGLAATMFAAVVAMVVIRSARSASLATMLANVLDRAGGLRLDTTGDVMNATSIVARETAQALWPASLVFPLFAVVAYIAQNRPRVVWSRIAPDLSRLSPAKAAGRLIGRRSLLEFSKAGGKIALAGAVAFAAIRSDLGVIVELPRTDPELVASAISRAALRLCAWIAAISALFAMADLIAARLSWRKRLRMTRQEMKDELRQSEGDPLVKGRFRSLARDRARRRMIDNVERATVVLVNPTHYAVALRYVREEGGAPVVVAKGRELVALKIRERAEERGIPVVENPPLVRAMYGVLEIDRMIPPEFYRAVAEIINLISRRAAGRQAPART